jgi:hypothetical protein
MALGELEWFFRQATTEVDDGVVEISSALSAFTACPVVVD